MKVLLHYPVATTAGLLAGYLSLAGRQIEIVTSLPELFKRLKAGGFDVAVLCPPPAVEWTEKLQRNLADAREKAPLVIYDRGMAPEAIAAEIDEAVRA